MNYIISVICRISIKIFLLKDSKDEYKSFVDEFEYVFLIACVHYISIKEGNL